MSRLVSEDLTKLVALGLGLAAAVAVAAPSRFTSRVAYEPLVAKLQASGGDAARIVRVRAVGDLAAFESGKRYKFVVAEAGALSVAPLPAEAPNNEYVHPILAGGGAVRTAGGLVVVRTPDGRLAKIVVDQDSKAYCPTFESLDEAVQALTRIGVAATLVARQPRVPECVAR